MTRGIPSHPVLAAMLALALLASFALPVGAATYTAVGAGDSVVSTDSQSASVLPTDALSSVDGPGHHFGFSEASVLAQTTTTSITKTIASIGGVAQPAGTTTGTVSPGQSVTFQVTPSLFSSSGFATVVDHFSPNLLFVGGDSCSTGATGRAAGFTAGSDNIVTCTPSSASPTFSITFTVSSAATAGSALTNTACGETTVGTTTSTFTTCATDTLTVSSAPGLTLTKTASPATLLVTGPNGGLGTGLNVGTGLALPGVQGLNGLSSLPGLNQLTYTITATNTSTSSATNGVTVTDTLPANVSFVSATSTVGTCSGSTTVTCTVGTLPASGSATITIIVVPVVPAACNTTLSNTASATGTGVTTAVTSAAVTTPVTCNILQNLVQNNLPLLPPPPLEFIPPPPPPLLPPPPPAPTGAVAAPRAAFPEVPVIPEADSLFLLVGGLVALGGLVGYRSLRRRRDDDIA